MWLISAKSASVFIVLLTWGMSALSAQTKETVPHPKDQIALQLGAIQMGYETPFVISDKISPEKMQKAINALVMGRNALNATITIPAEKVQGAIDCPRVDSIEYRDHRHDDFPPCANTYSHCSCMAVAMASRVCGAAICLTRPMDY